MGTWGVTWVGPRLSWRRGEGEATALREAETDLIPPARSQQPLDTRWSCFTLYSLWWCGERSMSEHYGTQGWLSLMWSYITRSNSTFLVMKLPVMLLPVSPFTYSAGEMNFCPRRSFCFVWHARSHVPEMIFSPFLGRISAPGSRTGAVVIKLGCIGERHLGHVTFGERTRGERGHFPSCAYSSSMCCEPVAALWQGFICD